MKQNRRYRKLLAPYLHLICLALIGTVFAVSVAPAETVDARKSAVLSSIGARYISARECDPSDKADFEQTCLRRQIAKALVGLKEGKSGGQDPDLILQQVAEQLPASPGWKRLSDPQNPAESKRIDPASDFPFLTATMLFRAAQQFNPERDTPGAEAAEQRIKPKTLDAIRNVFWQWASTECRIADAGPEYVWALWSTENHDAQRSHACWAAAELLSRSPEYRDRMFSDGSRAAEQLRAWTVHFSEIIRARANAGVSIEFFSPTYSKYLLSVFYNVFDFSSDAQLRALAGRYLSLWWALWAHEQVNGIHGGGKARFYFNQSPNDTPLAGLSWVYFEVGSDFGADQLAHTPILLSSYTPPPAVSCVVAAIRSGRFVGETWSRAVGLVAPRVAGRPTSVSDKLSITRYTFSAPGYVMGSVIVPRLKNNEWAPLSSQNRWSGIVLDGSLQDRVFAAPARGRQRSMYNAVATVQNHGTQIIGRMPAPFSREAGPMEIRFGKRLALSEGEGWIFAEGAAFVAARPAFGGYQVTDDKGVYRLTDSDAPVIIQAGSKTDYSNLASFRAAVLKADLRVDSSAVEFQGLDGAGRLRFNLTGEQVAFQNGQPLSPPGNWLYKGAYIAQRLGEQHTDIVCDSNVLKLDF